MIGNIKAYAKIHRIESFGIMLALTLVILLIDVGHVKVRANAEDRDFLSGTAVYTPEVATSLSGMRGEVVGVYGNKAHTSVATVIKFLDTTNMVLDANQYQLYVTGYNVTRGMMTKPQISHITGGYYLFPSTGYAVVYLSNASGFPSQALYTIVLCNESMAQVTTDSSKELKQKSNLFARQDGYELVINPAATEVKVAPFMEGTFDPAALYQSVVIDTKETQIRRALMQDVIDMNNQYKRIASDRTVLDSQGVDVPEVQDEIAYEYFENVEPWPLLKIPPADPPELDKEGLTDYSGFNLRYTTDETLNGVEFNWYECDLHSGVSFIDYLNVNDVSPMTFLGDLKKIQPPELVWEATFNSANVQMSDGTMLDLTQTFANVENIKTAVETYRNDVNSYYDLKKKYQTKDLISYLELEYEATETGTSYSSNTGIDKAVTLFNP